MNKVWDIFCEELTRSVKSDNLVVHSFVLMSNHYHLIASTPDANISKSMQQFMHRTSRRLTKAGNRINGTFAGRHYKCILQHPNYYLNAYKYNYQNPVRANLCFRSEYYVFSTLHYLVKNLPHPIPITDDSTYKDDPEGTLKWLNTQPESKKLEAVRFGLKHQFFQPKKDSITKKFLISDEEKI